jgi:hypothetical protein
MTHFWCSFFLSHPVFDGTQLHDLQSVINDLLPQWSGSLRAARDEDVQDTIVVGRNGRLFDAIHQVAPPKRGLGRAVLTGACKEVSFFLRHFEGTLPPELNHLTI